MSRCILSRQYLSDQGYARERVDGRLVRQHRLVYAQHFGPIPAGHDVHHRCGVKNCVNPEHLEALTRSEHRRRHDSWGAKARGARTHCKHGHEFTEANTFLHPTEGRVCRRCRVIATTKWRARRKAAA